MRTLSGQQDATPEHFVHSNSGIMLKILFTGITVICKDLFNSPCTPLVALSSNAVTTPYIDFEETDFLSLPDFFSKEHVFFYKFQ